MAAAVKVAEVVEFDIVVDELGVRESVWGGHGGVGGRGEQRQGRRAAGKRMSICTSAIGGEPVGVYNGLSPGGAGGVDNRIRDGPHPGYGAPASGRSAAVLGPSPSRWLSLHGRLHKLADGSHQGTECADGRRVSAGMRSRDGLVIGGNPTDLRQLSVAQRSPYDDIQLRKRVLAPRTAVFLFDKYLGAISGMSWYFHPPLTGTAPQPHSSQAATFLPNPACTLTARPHIVSGPVISVISHV